MSRHWDVCILLQGTQVWLQLVFSSCFLIQKWLPIECCSSVSAQSTCGELSARSTLPSVGCAVSCATGCAPCLQWPWECLYVLRGSFASTWDQSWTSIPHLCGATERPRQQDLRALLWNILGWYHVGCDMDCLVDRSGGWNICQESYLIRSWENGSENSEKVKEEGEKHSRHWAAPWEQHLFHSTPSALHSTWHIVGTQ